VVVTAQLMPQEGFAWEAPGHVITTDTGCQPPVPEDLKS
jgi:hypothetical protein